MISGQSAKRRKWQYQLKINLHFAEKSIDPGLRAPVNLRSRKQRTSHENNISPSERERNRYPH